MEFQHMIERFQELKNVGTFKDVDNVASCAFGKTTIIYGNNSYGKSTICDIFRSLSQNNPSLVEDRKTINSTSSPKIKIHFGNKSYAIYNGSWQYSNEGRQINDFLIFDNAFIERNVLTNSTIDRQNQENFTDFVIGDISVKLQTQLIEINTDKSSIESKATEIKKHIESIIKVPFNDFIKMPYKDNVHDEDVRKLGLQQQISSLTSDKAQLDTIKKLPLPKKLPFEDYSVDSFIRINDILSSSYAFKDEDILANFNKHKQHLNSRDIDFDSWANIGLKLQTDSHTCPFCGQEINNDKLILSYVTLFCHDFIQYSQSVENLNSFKFDHSNLLTFKTQLSDQHVLLSNLIPKIYVDNFEDTISRYRIVETELERSLNEVLTAQIEIETIFKNLIEQKQKNKYMHIDPANLDKLNEMFVTVRRNLTNYNELVQLIRDIAEEYIGALSVESIDAKIKEFQAEFDKLSTIILRNSLNTFVMEYNTLSASIAELDSQSKQIKTSFDQEQVKFLDTFFNDINFYYKKLGSKNYKIEKTTNMRGIKKTYSLKMFFNGTEIKNDKIQFVLSDSDKRALALSIFLAKVKNTDLNNVVIVMDDPITSFDEERMTLFINTLKTFSAAEQIIILTHYKEFYKKFFELNYELEPKPALIKIEYMPGTNKLKQVDRESDHLLMNDYEICLHKMWSFIRGDIHDFSSNEARTLIFKRLIYRYYYDIKDKNIKIGKLKQLLLDLRDNSIISGDMYTRLDAKRVEYNIPSHTFDSDSEDSKRKSIEDLRDILSLI